MHTGFVNFVKEAVDARDPEDSLEVAKQREIFLREFAGTIFDDHTFGDPPIRGPYEEVEIILKPGIIDVVVIQFSEIFHQSIIPGNVF